MTCHLLLRPIFYVRGGGYPGIFDSVNFYKIEKNRQLRKDYLK